MARRRRARPGLHRRDGRAAVRPSTAFAFDVADVLNWANCDVEPVDVLVSNATLQWVPGHLDLLPRPGRRRRAPAAGSPSRCRELRRAQPLLRGDWPLRRRTPSTRRRVALPASHDPRSTSTRCPAWAARSTPGRRRTSTCCPARTRSSRGSPAPAPGPRCRRCPTTCAGVRGRAQAPAARGLPGRADGTSCCRSAGSSSSPHASA